MCEVLVVANPVYKVFRESHIANRGGREAVAPSKAIALPGCKVGAVICEAPAEVGQPSGIALDEYEQYLATESRMLEKIVRDAKLVKSL